MENQVEKTTDNDVETTVWGLGLESTWKLGLHFGYGGVMPFI